MTCEDQKGDCLNCNDRAPGTCILMETHEMEYYCNRHQFSPRRPAMIEIVRRKLSADPIARERLKAGLANVSLNGEGYVSLTDAVSLANWLIQIFELQQSAFDEVYIKDLKKLGEELLAERRVS